MDRLTDLGCIPERVVANMTTEQLAGIYRKLCEYENTELEPQDVPDALEICKIKIALDNLAEYQDTNLSPEQIKAMDEMYLKKCQEVNLLTERLQELEKEKMNYEVECAWNYRKGLEHAADIIQSHMKDDGWIPVEKRLPEETIETFDGVFSSESVIVTTINENGELLCACDFLIGKQWVCAAGNEKVIAWRPLPEPYQPKE